MREQERLIVDRIIVGNNIERRKSDYEAFSSVVWNTNGQDPRKVFEEYNSHGFKIRPQEELDQIYKDFGDVRRDEYFDEESSCKSMLESKIAYDWAEGESGKHLVATSPDYLYKYIIIFGEDQVANWAQELIDQVECVKRNTYEDSEGVRYNSIIFK